MVSDKPYTRATFRRMNCEIGCGEFRLGCTRHRSNISNRWTDSWEAKYQRLVEYKEAAGDVLVPHAYETKDGRKLGHWVVVQRARKYGKTRSSRLSAGKIERLDALNFV